MSSTNHWKLGLFVLMSLAVFIGVSFWLGAKRFDRDTMFAFTYLDEAVDGLDLGSPVKFRGVQIGTVSSIRAAPDKVLLEIEAKIDVKSVTDLGLSNPRENQVGMRPGLRAQLQRTWVTGVAWVQIDFFDERSYPMPHYSFELPENVVHAVPSPQRSLELGLQESLHRVPALMDSITAAATSLSKAIDRIDFEHVSSELANVLASVDKILIQVEEEGIVRESSLAIQDLRGTLTSISSLSDGLSAEGSALHSVINELHATLIALKQLLIESEPGPTMAGLRRASDEFSLMMRSLRRLADMLERDPGALLHGRQANKVPFPEER